MSEFRRRLMAQKKGLLPAEYTELEYVESSKTQYIDTKIVLTERNAVILNGFQNVSGVNAAIFGATNLTTYRGITIGVTGNTNRLTFGSVFEQDRLDIPNKRDSNNTYKLSGKLLQCNDVIKEINNTIKFNTINTAFLFRGSPNWPYGDFFPCRVYGLKIFEYDNLILNFIPVINPQGEIGMYDTVSCKFFGNDGTGVFTAGYKK